MAMRRRDLVLGMAAFGAAVSLPTIAHARAIGGHAFGSAWRLVAAETANFEAARSGIERIIADVDASMSPYRAVSAISRFNCADTVDGQAMPAALRGVTKAALDMARDTDGAFDPTVGPLVSRFGFGPIEGATGRWSAISVDAETIAKDEPGLTLDLCGIAKGHALDRIVSDLQSAGVGGALVELGGEVAALGRHPDGRPWQVAVEDPFVSDFAAQRVVAPGAMRLATSGHRVNGVFGRTSHIIDARKARPALGAIGSVSVLAGDAMHADALATALCAMPDEAAMAYAQDNTINALFILADGAANREVMTGRFASHIVA